MFFLLGTAFHVPLTLSPPLSLVPIPFGIPGEITCVFEADRLQVLNELSFFLFPLPAGWVF